MTSPETMDDDDADLWRILDFAAANAKVFLVAATTGALLGIGSWLALGSYKAQLIVNVEKVGNAAGSNDTRQDKAVPEASIDYLSWRALEQNLPLLADEMLRAGKVDDSERGYFERMANPKWWPQHVSATYALTKSDTKALAGISKGLQEAEASTILNLTLSMEHRSPDAAQKGLGVAADFIQRGAAHLAVRSLLNAYLARTHSSEASVRQRLSAAELELRYQRERARRLEALRLRFPQKGASTVQPILDVKDTNAKYMPIVAQLVAVYMDIDMQEESLTRLRAEMEQNEIRRDFLARALPVLTEELDGLKLIDGLLAVESAMRHKVATSQGERLHALNAIRADLVSVRTRFVNGLAMNHATKPTRSGPWLPAASGLLVGILGALAWLLARQVSMSRRRSLGSASGQ